MGIFKARGVRTGRLLLEGNLCMQVVGFGVLLHWLKVFSITWGCLRGEVCEVGHFNYQVPVIRKEFSDQGL